MKHRRNLLRCESSADNWLYRALDQLLPHKEKLEAFLKDRLGQLFELEYDLLLYDITSAYFEGQANFELAQRGYSRDKRSDSGQVCLGLVVSRCGMPIGFGLMEAPSRQIVFNPRRFANAWRVSSHIASTQGSMRFVHPPPASVVEGRTENSDSMLLFLEAEGKRLAEPTAVTVMQPGLYTTFADRSASLPADLIVDSYLVHFDPIGSNPVQGPQSVEGSVTFDRPILGVICRGDQLAASDSLFGHPGTEYTASPQYELYPGANTVGFMTNERPGYVTRGLSGLWGKSVRSPPFPNDRIRLSSDRRTLSVRCSAGGEADALRILVSATDAEFPMHEAQPVNSSEPFHGRPFRVGEIIEAEDYDLGGNGVGYYDLSPDALANVYRTKEGVELVSFLLGSREEIAVCRTHAGEWLAYSVNIDQPGLYVIQAHMASMRGGGSFQFELGETITTPPIPIPRIPIYSTGEFPPDLFQTVESEPVWLESGRRTLRVLMGENNSRHRIADFDWFRIVPAEDAGPSTRGDRSGPASPP